MNGEIKRLYKNFFIKNYNITCKIEEPIIFPTYKGSVLRGAFGRNLKRISCLNKEEKDCLNCIFKKGCVYFYLFENGIQNEESQFLENIKFRPHPFIIEPPLTEKNEYSKGETLSFNIILIGLRTDSYLPFIISALIKMGEYGLYKTGEGKFILERIETIDSKTIYTLKEGLILYKDNDSDLLKEKIHRKKFNKIEINFLTPTRILHRGKYSSNINFYIFMKSILHRFITLSSLYNNFEVNIDKDILSKSKLIEIESSNINWYDWETFSGRQKTEIKLGGVIGKIIYSGDITPFLSLITIGKHIHIGKNTSYGLGKYNYFLL